MAVTVVIVCAALSFGAEHVVDYHSAELFPERWFDLVLVLRADNSVLYSRLESRGYSDKKLADNVEAEIMQVILDEAREAYREEIVIELPSNTIEDMEANLTRTMQWLENWRPPPPAES